jgi:RNA polymerase sigma factor (sigma-70 family)
LLLPAYLFFIHKHAAPQDHVNCYKSKQEIISIILHTDQRYVNALVQNDTLVIREIYEKYSGKIMQYVIDNNGSKDDAADIFQEALIAIYRQAKQKQLQLTCPFEPFLLLICKRQWLNELKKRNRRPVTKELDDVSIGEDVYALAEQLQQYDKKMQLFLQCLNELGAICREIIQKCLSGQDQEQIALQLNMKYGYLRKKKSECMASLAKKIYEKKAGLL